MELITNIIGFTAAAVGTALMLPQVIKSIKTKSVKDVSFAMLILYFFNCVLFAIYGALIIAWPVIICNMIAFLVSTTQIVLKFRYD